MAKRDAFLLRIDPEILAALRRWADDDLRSLNAQIDYLLRQRLREAGRMPARGTGGRRREEARGGNAPGEDSGPD